MDEVAGGRFRGVYTMCDSEPAVGVMEDCLSLQCPYCGEPVELQIDIGGGPRQEYVEDCPVCCRPWQVGAWIQDDGAWCAILRTADE